MRNGTKSWGQNPGPLKPSSVIQSNVSYGFSKKQGTKVVIRAYIFLLVRQLNRVRWPQFLCTMLTHVTSL